MGEDRRSFLQKLTLGVSALAAMPLGAMNTTKEEEMNKGNGVKSTKPLGFQWETQDPFLFCVHHEDKFPKGNDVMGPATPLSGRNMGNDFLVKDGFRMYHGRQVPGFPGQGIERNAPQALIYGWVLQFGYAFIPYLLYRVFRPEQPAKLGGSWFSLVTVHVGSVFLWASIFLDPYAGPLRGVAYAVWVISMMPIVSEVKSIVEAYLQPGMEDEFGTLAEEAQVRRA